MEIEELPGGFEDHVNAISGVVDEIPEDHCHAFKSISFDVKESFWVSLNNLDKEGHPGIKGLAKTVVHKFIINSVCPGNCA